MEPNPTPSRLGWLERLKIRRITMGTITSSGVPNLERAATIEGDLDPTVPNLQSTNTLVGRTYLELKKRINEFNLAKSGVLTSRSQEDLRLTSKKGGFSGSFFPSPSRKSDQCFEGAGTGSCHSEDVAEIEGISEKENKESGQKLSESVAQGGKSKPKITITLSEKGENQAYFKENKKSSGSNEGVKAKRETGISGGMSTPQMPEIVIDPPSDTSRDPESGTTEKTSSRKLQFDMQNVSDIKDIDEEISCELSSRNA